MNSTEQRLLNRRMFRKVDGFPAAMFNTMLTKLLTEATSRPYDFTYEVESHAVSEEDPYDDDEKEVKKVRVFGPRIVREITICWRPAGDTDLQFAHVEHLAIYYTPADGSLTLEGTVVNPITKKREDSYRTDYNIGFNNSEIILSIRKKIGAILKVLRAYWDVELPQKKKDRAVNFICSIFPEIVDEYILEGEESDDDEE